jgi:hypothetical protein
VRWCGSSIMRTSAGYGVVRKKAGKRNEASPVCCGV